MILTVAHLNHIPMDCRDQNLRALCQRCHNSYDMPQRIRNRQAKARARKACGDLFETP